MTARGRGFLCRHAPRALTAGLGLTSSAAGLLLLALAVPRAAGAGWPAVAAGLGRAGAGWWVLLCALAAAAMWAYTYVMCAALPGLTRPQALMVNCTSSAASDLLPFGGAVGVAVTYAMTRRWGHPPQAVAVSTVVTGACNVLTRLLLSAAGLLVLAAMAVPGAGWALAGGALLLAVLPVPVAGWLARGGPARAAAAGESGAGRVSERAHQVPVARRPVTSVGVVTRRVRRALVRCREDCRELVRQSWRVLALGMAGTMAAQALLFVACLHAAGAGTEPGAGLAVFAASRLLTQIAITPGGIGFTESAAAYTLVALGGAPGEVAAGMLLFAALTHLVEIPLGCLTGAFWLLREGRRSPVPGTGPPAEPMPAVPRRLPTTR